MTEEQEIEREDAFTPGDEPKSSRGVLAALSKAEDAFREWQTTCEHIDRIYNLDGAGYGGTRADLDSYHWRDAELDLFWASYEVLKPAVYARPPVPMVAPLFKDGKPLHNTTAELLERCAISVFARTGIDDVMLLLRDDLIFTGRGAPWVRYEKDKDGHQVCIEHKDRLDFLHEPARKWCEVGWVAGAAWMTRKEMRKRFARTSGDAYKDAKYSVTRSDDRDRDLEDRASSRKCKVWEVWHKADNKVYWVTEGVEVLLDSADPYLKLTGFFPCPKPAYATLRRRSLIPVPDWERYAIHFSKISELTRRIYSLLDLVKMKGLIPAGGDVGDSIEELIRSDDDALLIPVPAASLMGDAKNFVHWLPLTELATAIQGLIEARTQLIQDFYQLSGISDIMRGATEAEETLGAQELKTQFGSVRVREKSMELQRVAADTVKIAAEIIAEKFPKEALLEMSQLEIPSKSDIEKRIKDIEEGAKQEIEALGEKAREQADAARQSGQEIDPQQAKAMLERTQQQILAKYAPMLAEAEQQVPIEDVMKLLRDDRARAFVFEIESSSTILTDELQEKRSRNEFMGEFATAQQALAGLAAMGEPGAKLAGAMMKFVLAPYRAGRDLDGAIDEFIDAAPEMARMAQQQSGESEALVEANNKLAEAEQMKAQAAMAGVQAKAQLDRAEMQRKMAEMQQKAQEAEFKAMAEAEKLRQSLSAEQAKTAQIEAQINKLTAETAAILNKIGLDVRQQELAEYQAAEQSQARQVDQAMRAEDSAVERDFRERGENRADRGEDRADRQQQFSEQEARNAGA